MDHRKAIRRASTSAAILGVWLCLAGKVALGQPETLTITRAVEIAESNHPTLREARERAAAARARAQAARGKIFPQVSLNAIGKLGLSGATNGLGLVGLPASPFYRNLSGALNVNQTFWDFGRTRHSAAALAAEAEATEHDLDAIRIEVSERAKESFVRVLTAQRVVKVREQGLRERQEILRKAEQFSEVGLSSRLEVALAQVGLSTAELGVIQARSEERTAWSELFAALGRAEGEHYVLVEPPIELSPPGELSEAIARALALRPDLKSLEAQVKGQRERVEYARSLRRPALSGVWSGGYARFADLSLSRLMVGGLGIFAPLYTGGDLESQVKLEEHQLEALRAHYSSRVLEVQTEVSRACAELVNAAESARAHEKISTYAESALRLARTRYQAQLTSFIELLTAERAAEEARASSTEALYKYQTALARLRASTGLDPK